MRKKLVISTGAGMSAESGINTFRDHDGLWENYDVMDVASADGFRRNPKLIHDFYNARRRELIKANPNAGHLGLVELENGMIHISLPRMSTISMNEQAARMCFISTAS